MCDTEQSASLQVDIREYLPSVRDFWCSLYPSDPVCQNNPTDADQPLSGLQIEAQEPDESAIVSLVQRLATGLSSDRDSVIALLKRNPQFRQAALGALDTALETSDQPLVWHNGLRIFLESAPEHLVEIIYSANSNLREKSRRFYATFLKCAETPFAILKFFVPCSIERVKDPIIRALSRAPAGDADAIKVLNEALCIHLGGPAQVAEACRSLGPHLPEWSRFLHRMAGLFDSFEQQRDDLLANDFYVCAEPPLDWQEPLCADLTDSFPPGELPSAILRVIISFFELQPGKGHFEILRQLRNYSFDWQILLPALAYVPVGITERLFDLSPLKLQPRVAPMLPDEAAKLLASLVDKFYPGNAVDIGIFASEIADRSPAIFEEVAFKTSDMPEFPRVMLPKLPDAIFSKLNKADREGKHVRWSKGNLGAARAAHEIAFDGDESELALIEMEQHPLFCRAVMPHLLMEAAKPSASRDSILSALMLIRQVPGLGNVDRDFEPVLDLISQRQSTGILEHICDDTGLRSHLLSVARTIIVRWRSSDSPEDLLQDFCLEWTAKLKRPQGLGFDEFRCLSLTAWVRTSFIRFIYSRLRSTRNRPACWDHERSEEFVDPHGSGFVDQMANREFIEQSLQRLDPLDRRIIQLACLEQWETGEVAECLGLSESTICYRRDQALASLKFALRQLDHQSTQILRRPPQSLNGSHPRTKPGD